MHGGKPVHPGVAYQADAIDPPLPPDCVVWRIECDGPALAGLDVVVIDHHRPDDPGYGRGPEEFLPASSIGQVISLLGRVADYPTTWQRIAVPRHPHWCGALSLHDGRWAARTTSVHGDPGYDRDDEATAAVISDTLVAAAAADHCLEAAYRGRCPGVEPDALMRWRAESRAEFQRRPVSDVLGDIEAARQKLRDAIAGRAAGGCHWDAAESIPELPEAAAREGIPFIADMADRDGRTKVVLQAAPPALVERFLAGGIVPGLIDMYGDPARGFAGGYICPHAGDRVSRRGQ